MRLRTGAGKTLAVGADEALRMKEAQGGRAARSESGVKENDGIQDS